MSKTPKLKNHPFPLILRRVRLERGLTITELGRMINSDRSMIYNYESHRVEPGLMMIHKLSSALGIDPNCLLGWKCEGGLDRGIESVVHLQRRAAPDLEKAMSYELFLKRTQRAGEERVTISKRGTSIFLSKAVTDNYFEGYEFAQIFVDQKSDPKSVRIGLRPLKKAENNTYSLIRHKRAKSAFITARALLGHIGYKNTKSHSMPAEWVERTANGRKLNLLEFAIDKSLCGEE